ncbi:uncharacterized protein LOC124410533 [Diprion similis]|uniref:uncharacterized protein LOC124410533 n=1 Tax=Diprion similis TaxID=362088 RepID=UPI001EF93888|nr:uncharacterized protein LOC124410533 [Diprion similis]
MLEAVPLPSEWAVKSYNSKPYYLVELCKCSTHDIDEYVQVENHFDDYNVVKIERVQNPYQYGKYLLYKLQKDNPLEVIYFMPLEDKEQLQTALRFNCDYRRLGHSRDKFFGSVSTAVSYCASYKKIVIVQALRNYFTHDAGRYPKYVVTYETYR